MRKLGLAIVLALAGCAGTLRQPLLLGSTFDATALPAWNAVADAKTATVLCPKCLQPRITPQYARDKAGHECLVWSCANCGAVWYTRVAMPDLHTSP